MSVLHGHTWRIVAASGSTVIDSERVGKGAAPSIDTHATAGELPGRLAQPAHRDAGVGYVGAVREPATHGESVTPRQFVRLDHLDPSVVRDDHAVRHPSRRRTRRSSRRSPARATTRHVATTTAPARARRRPRGRGRWPPRAGRSGVHGRVGRGSGGGVPSVRARSPPVTITDSAGWSRSNRTTSASLVATCT